MDQIREVYAEYCGRFIDKEDIDNILGGCTIQVNRGGTVKYAQFIQVKNRKELDHHKELIRKHFTFYD